MFIVSGLFLPHLSLHFQDGGPRFRVSLGKLLDLGLEHKILGVEMLLIPEECFLFVDAAAFLLFSQMWKKGKSCLDWIAWPLAIEVQGLLLACAHDK